MTTVRDEGFFSSLPLANAIQQRNEWSKESGYTRLVSGGYMLTAPKGYGSLYVASVEDARYKVKGELAAGADLIKFSVEDGYGGAHNLPLLSADEITAIISTAYEQGRRVSAHVTQAQYLQMVVDAGVDDAAHMVWDSIPESLLQQMINDYTDIPQNNFDHFELGMPMHEITRMQEAGLTPAQIILAATQNAAHVCGLEDELGTLEPGKLADILVVNGNPLRDGQALTNVQMVVHNGVVIRDESQ